MKYINIILIWVKSVKVFMLSTLLVLSLLFTVVSHTVTGVASLVSDFLYWSLGTSVIRGLEGSVDKLTNNNGILEKKVARVKKKNGGLKRVSSGLSKSNASLKKENSDVKKMNGDLNKVNSDLNKSNVRLKKENGDVKIINGGLKKVNAGLNKANGILKKESRDINKINGSLEMENANLNVNNKVLGGRVKKLEATTSEMNSNINQFKKSATHIIDGIRRRIAKTVAVNVGSMPLESIPLLGVATIIMVTSTEVYAACEDVKDLDRLQDLYDPQSESEARNEVCGVELPTEDELKNNWGDKKKDIKEDIKKKLDHWF
jgi:hypothetical protein